MERLGKSKTERRMVGSRQSIPSWISAAANRVDFDGNTSTMLKDGRDGSSSEHYKPLSDVNLGFGERALSAAGAAVLSAILVNPLDIAKVFFFSQLFAEFSTHHLLLSSCFRCCYVGWWFFVLNILFFFFFSFINSLVLC